MLWTRFIYLFLLLCLFFINCMFFTIYFYVIFSSGIIISNYFDSFYYFLLILFFSNHFLSSFLRPNKSVAAKQKKKINWLKFHISKYISIFVYMYVPPFHHFLLTSRKSFVQYSINLPTASNPIPQRLPSSHIYQATHSGV